MSGAPGSRGARERSQAALAESRFSFAGLSGNGCAARPVRMEGPVRFGSRTAGTAAEVVGPILYLPAPGGVVYFVGLVYVLCISTTVCITCTPVGVLDGDFGGGGWEFGVFGGGAGRGDLIR